MLFRDNEAVEQVLKCAEASLISISPKTSKWCRRPRDWPYSPQFVLACSAGRFRSFHLIPVFLWAVFPPQLVHVPAHCAIHTCSPPSPCAGTVSCLVLIVYLDARSLVEARRVGSETQEVGDGRGLQVARLTAPWFIPSTLLTPPLNWDHNRVWDGADSAGSESKARNRCQSKASAPADFPNWQTSSTVSGNSPARPHQYIQISVTSYFLRGYSARHTDNRVLIILEIWEHVAISYAYYLSDLVVELKTSRRSGLAKFQLYLW